MKSSIIPAVPDAQRGTLVLQVCAAQHKSSL